MERFNMMMDERAPSWSQGDRMLSLGRGGWEKTFRLLPLFLLVLICWQEAAAEGGADLRLWTDNQGRKVEAAFGGLEGNSVLLVMKDGSKVPFPLERLSETDRDYAKKQPPAAPQVVDRVAPGKRTWPDKVEVPLRTLEKLDLIVDEPQNRKYVYQSTAFEFTSQDKLAGSVMREIARTFEATRLLVGSLPWGIACNPPNPLERYQAALYETREDYINNGGPANSGGVYDSGDMIFKIPFPSLGLTRTGKTWYKDENYRNDTLVHEITHQMMHDYLPFLPKWIVEGSAEYTEMIPYNAGVFRVGSHKTGIKDHLDEALNSGAAPDVGSVREHVTMTRDRWNELSTDSASMRRLYLRSVILVYFFNHLDGDGKGTRFMDFFDGAFTQVQTVNEFFANPAVKRMPGGRFSYPSNLTPPDMSPDTAPFKHIDKLLAGRDYAALAGEIVEGYRSIGIRVSASE